MMIKLSAAQRGGHVHVAVWVGPHAGELAHSGRLVFRIDEWATFARVAELTELTLAVDDEVGDVRVERTLGVLVAPKAST